MAGAPAGTSTTSKSASNAIITPSSAGASSAHTLCLAAAVSTCSGGDRERLGCADPRCDRRRDPDRHHPCRVTPRTALHRPAPAHPGAARHATRQRRAGTRRRPGHRRTRSDAPGAKPMTDALYGDLVHEPGVYTMPEDWYHSDPVPGGSLSASGAKLLLPPSCPAKFAWARSHPAKPKRAFDLGHAAHKLVLGVGAPLVEIVGSGKDPNAWATDKTKAEVQAVRDAGAIPLKSSDYEAVHGMAQALHDSKDARRLFENGLPELGPGRMIVPDYKSADDASPDTFRRQAASFGYSRQAAWYLRLLAALGISSDAAFVFVVQETTPPYLVSICQLDDDAMLIGDHEMTQALDIYAECTATGDWYGFDREVNLISLPAWKRREYMESFA